MRSRRRSSAAEAALAATPEPEPEPEPEPTPTPTGRRAQAQAQTAQAQSRALDVVLAQGCEWHVQPGLGKYGITVETDARGTVREYVTWVPQIGRVHKIPLYDGFFALLDSGALA
jgi:hypothetical protein